MYTVQEEYKALDIKTDLTVMIAAEKVRTKSDRQFTCEVQYELNGLLMSKVAIAEIVENGE